MERKTMGSFIAVLRKANGMTQRELAERLNVSDKAVSRWERDENAPDLSLIPVIAEIFGVSSDELLRGERADPVLTNTGRAAEKTEKQIDRLASSVSAGFRIHSVISGGVALAGLIAAMICDLGFLRAYIGFFAASVFFVAAVVYETVFLIRAFSAINGEFEGEAVNRCKKSLVSAAKLVFSLILVLFSATLPLIIFPPQTYMGLNADSWLKTGGLFAAGAALVCGFICPVVSHVAVKRKVYIPGAEENTSAKRFYSHIGLTLVFMGATLLLHLILTTNVILYAEGTVFEFESGDFEDFIDYMKKPLPDPYGNSVFNMTAPYYRGGREVSRREALTEYVRDPKGKELFSYLNMNMAVGQVSYEWNGDQLQSITAYTYEQLNEGRAVMRKISAGFIVLYAAELAASVIIYSRRKKN